MIRAVLSCALALGLLSACGNLPIPGQSGAAGPDPVFAAAVQAGSPVLQVIVDSTGDNTAIVRETFRNGIGTWVSSDSLSVALDDAGFLIATRGLGGDMLGSDVSESRALVLAAQPGRATRLHSFLDFNNKSVQRAYICDITRRANTVVDFGTARIPARFVVEDCASSDQRFVALYWLDAQGRIIQSRQWAGDFAGTLTFRIVP